MSKYYAKIGFSGGRDICNLLLIDYTGYHFCYFFLVLLLGFISYINDSQFILYQRHGFICLFVCVFERYIY